MPYQSVTLAQFRTELQEKLESVPFWQNSEANNAINESLRQWNMLTGQWKKSQTTPTVANQIWYTFSSSFVYNMRVSFNGQSLDITSTGSLDNGRSSWEGETTASGSPVPTRPLHWAPSGLRRLAIWPADAVGANSLLLDGVCITPVLTADADFLDLAQSEHDAILGEALCLLTFKEGGSRFEAAKIFHQQFLLAASQVNERLSASAYFRKAMGLDLYRGEKPILSREAGL